MDIFFLHCVNIYWKEKGGSYVLWYFSKFNTCNSFFRGLPLVYKNGLWVHWIKIRRPLGIYTYPPQVGTILRYKEYSRKPLKDQVEATICRTSSDTALIWLLHFITIPYSSFPSSFPLSYGALL
jgi:hypothetical protein